jgi:Zn-dependent protease
LQALAAEAEQAVAAGDAAASRETWRRALELVPTTSRQSTQIAEKITELTSRIESQAPTATAPAKWPAWAKSTGPLVAVALLLWKFKFIALAILSKGKLLLIGLTKSSTLLTMLLSLGVYWTVWGWRFALGFVVSIYIHEMGHVAALQRYGIKATAPMFVPGLGAFVRLNQYPASPAEDARVGLAGPLWGLATAGAAYAIFLASDAPLFAAIARAGAWINLFNLLPVWQLDGGRGFSALSRGQRFVLLAVVAAAGFATGEGLLLLIGLVAAARAFGGTAPAKPDGGVLAQFAILVIALAALSAIHVPGIAPR